MALAIAVFHSSVLLLLESGDAVICGIGAVRRASGVGEKMKGTTAKSGGLTSMQELAVKMVGLWAGEEIWKAVAMILVLETADSCWVGKQSIVALCCD